jgi:hypothetical protein
MKGYLSDDTNLERGSVDDRGDAKYVRLSQNTPDGYVYDLQSDLRSLGFAKVGQPDGAFGPNTKRAVQAFQKLAGMGATGIVDRDTKDAIILWMKQGYTKHNPPGSEEDDLIIAPDGTKLITPRVPHFSQGDPRWAQRILGRGSSIRREGCAITCISMILSFYGRNVTPKILDSYLDTNNGYVGNSVKWDVAGKCEEPGNGLRLTYARMKGNQDKLSGFLSERTEQNLPTMVRVDYGADANLVYNHFVVCIGMTENSDFVMNDPATSQGDGYEHTLDDNIIQRTTRKNGYSIVQLDFYDPK